jgi:hypothetical protein
MYQLEIRHICLQYATQFVTLTHTEFLGIAIDEYAALSDKSNYLVNHYVENVIWCLHAIHVPSFKRRYNAWTFKVKRTPIQSGRPLCLLLSQPRHP